MLCHHAPMLAHEAELAGTGSRDEAAERPQGVAESS